MNATSMTSARLLSAPVLVLNRCWVPVHVTTVRRALCLVYRGAARVVAPDTLEVHSFHEWVCLPDPPATSWLRGVRTRVPVPEVIHLVTYDRVPRYEAPFTRRNLYHRDDYTCQYCGVRLPVDRLSIDHVRPRSKGGKTSWDNCVLACVRCNTRKADRSPQEARLRLMRQPKRPRWSPYLGVANDKQLPSWQRFLHARDEVR
ncbi:MAG TPA: HNH endonuclease [Planctomycetota bacterium]|nr:HNH endonuclease [Planctomycetota bacterium]